MVCAQPRPVVQDTLPINAILWVRSVSPEDQGVGRRIAEDLEDLVRPNGQGFQLIDVEDRTDFLNVLSEIAVSCDAGLHPVLIVDAHGDADKGVLLAPSGDWVSWPDTLEALGSINRATGAGLICIFALCHGLHLYKSVELKRPAPAHLFYAPEGVIKNGELEDRLPPFFRALMEGGNVAAAFTDHLSPVMSSMNCQTLFLKALALYVRNHCRGAGKRTRQEKVVTRLLAQDGRAMPNRKKLRSARARAKTGLRPGPHIIDLFAQTFLMGRPVAFTYQDVAQLAGIDAS